LNKNKAVSDPKRFQYSEAIYLVDTIIKEII
jgi:hypothetical protein